MDIYRTILLGVGVGVIGWLIHPILLFFFGTIWALIVFQYHDKYCKYGFCYHYKEEMEVKV